MSRLANYYMKHNCLENNQESTTNVHQVNNSKSYRMYHINQGYTHRIHGKNKSLRPNNIKPSHNKQAELQSVWNKSNGLFFNFSNPVQQKRMEVEAIENKIKKYLEHIQKIKERHREHNKQSRDCEKKAQTSRIKVVKKSQQKFRTIQPSMKFEKSDYMTLNLHSVYHPKKNTFKNKTSDSIPCSKNWPTKKANQSSIEPSLNGQPFLCNTIVLKEYKKADEQSKRIQGLKQRSRSQRTGRLQQGYRFLNKDNQNNVKNLSNKNEERRGKSRKNSEIVGWQVHGSNIVDICWNSKQLSQCTKKQ